MAEIRWSHEAALWLKEIYDYIAQDNPSAARKVVSGIYEKAQLLSDFPELGHKYRDEPDARSECFSMDTTESPTSSA
jgi:plasmid stabilization system protein ParE